MSHHPYPNDNFNRTPSSASMARKCKSDALNIIFTLIPWPSME